MSRLVDRGRAAVYAAENKVFGWSGPGMTEKGCRSYVRSVTTMGYYMRAGGWKRIRVRFAPGNATRSYWSTRDREISLSRCGRRNWVILHEMAHALTERTHPGAPWHGRTFRYHYCQLVDCWLGLGKGRELREAFESAGQPVPHLL